MSMLDKLKGMMKGHEDKTREGVEKGGDQVDRRTGGTYRSQVDTAQEQADKRLGTDEDPPRQP